MRGFNTKITKLFESRVFFCGVIAFFVFEAVWAAISAAYPMAFDEDFHLGIIRIYSHHLLPFLSSQPDNASQFGAVAADPSYFYHYLMSFPFRLISLFTDSQTIQVLFLRGINIAMAAASLVLFRRVMLKAGIGTALANASLLIFALIPIVPLLAGQINYDNLLLLLTAWTCLLVFRIYDDSKKGVVDLKYISAFVIVCLFSSLVKYAFLPLVLVSAGFVVWCIVRAFRNWGKLKSAVARAYSKLSWFYRLLLVLLLVISLGLFVQRYGMNIVKYHTPVPDCSDVIGEDECMYYGPWARNNMLEQQKPADFSASPISYTWKWASGLHYRLFFMINGSHDSYHNYPPLPVPAVTAAVIAISGLVAVAVYWRKLFAGNPILLFLFLLGAFYCCVLWVEDYSQFAETAQPVAINGRYLLPIILPMAVVFIKALGVALNRLKNVKMIVVLAVILLFAQGGGIVSFVVRSNTAWYWPNSTIEHINGGAKRLLSPFVVGDY